MRYSAIPLAFAAVVSAATISIDVGEEGIVFDPKTSTAAVGDILEFHFYSGAGPHSVVRSTYESPCVPASDAFFSGLLQGTDSGSETFTVAVTTTDPIWFYCSAQRHCQNGMSGVVNPASGQSQADYAARARSVSRASAPASPTGGAVATAASSASATDSSVTSSASSAASSASSASVSGSSSVSAEASSASSSAASVASSASSATRSASSSATESAASATSTNVAMGQKAELGAYAVAVAGGLMALLA